MQLYNNSPAQIEGRDLRRRGNAVGMSLIFMLIIQYILTFAYLIISALVFGIPFEQATSYIFDDIIIGYSLNTVFCVVAYISCSLVLTRPLHCKIGRIAGLGSAKQPRLIPLFILFGMGAAMSGNLVSNWISNLCRLLFNIVPYSPTIGGDSSITLGSYLFMFLTVAVFPALIEEFFFRGVVYGVLERFGPTVAIVVSTVVFAVVHQNFSQIPFVLIFAFALGVIRAVSGSIWPCIALHFINNAFSLLLGLAPIAYQATILSVANAVLILGGVLAALRLHKLGVLPPRPDVPSCFSSAARTVRVLFSPAMIVAMALMLLTAMSYFAEV